MHGTLPRFCLLHFLNNHSVVVKNIWQTGAYKRPAIAIKNVRHKPLLFNSVHGWTEYTTRTSAQHGSLHREISSAGKLIPQTHLNRILDGAGRGVRGQRDHIRRSCSQRAGGSEMSCFLHSTTSRVVQKGARRRIHHTTPPTLPPTFCTALNGK